MVLATSQARRIEEAVAAYRLETGSYPADLDRLVAAGWLDANELVYPLGLPYVYQTTKDGFELAPPLEEPR
jgi:hypothetical protein